MIKKYAVFFFFPILILTLTTSGIANRPSDPPSRSLNDVSICSWFGCKTAAASFSMDDSNHFCGPELEAAGFRGTYYHIGDQTPSWIPAFSNAGHEIGSHLVFHDQSCFEIPSCFPNCTIETLRQTPYTQAEVTNFRLNQLEPSIAAIESGTGKPVLSMAWTCGTTDARRMAAAEHYLIGSRGYFVDFINNFTWILNNETRSPVEIQNLNSIDVNFNIPAYVDQAIASGGWTILTSHEYCEGISYLGSRSNILWNATIGEILKYIKVRDAASFSNYSYNGTSINFNAVHTLSTFQRQKVNGTFFLPVVYDNPVTIQVHIGDTDHILGVSNNGSATPFSIITKNNSRYVIFNTPLNTLRNINISIDSTPLPTSTPQTSTPIGPTPSLTPTLIPSPTPLTTPQPTTPGEPQFPVSLWNDSFTPAEPMVFDSGAVELGVKFRSSLPGFITGLRFYKSQNNTGPHLANLWSADGSLLAQTTFSNESPSGWQQVLFPNPVPIAPNTTYIASYHTSTGFFSVSRQYFSQGFTNYPLYAFASSEIEGGNGVYRYGASSFPNQSFAQSNYWVDVIFTNQTSSPTATPTPSPSPTPTSSPSPAPTATLSPTSTYTPLPTFTSTPLPSSTPITDLIFADSFESGNLSRWSSSVLDNGDLEVSSQAAMTGLFGLRATVNDNNSIYVIDYSPANESRYRARFYFNQNSIAMSNGNAHFIFQGVMGSNTPVTRIEYRYYNSNYQIRTGALNNSSTWTNSGWFTISNSSHSIEIDWAAATASGANNGRLTLWIDGIQRANLTGINNNLRRIDTAFLGAISGIDNGTRGIYYFDHFESRRSTYIGP